MLYSEEAEALKKAAWPKCDELAEKLAAKGVAAADALEAATKSRIHHVRSAALRNLTKVSPERGKQLAQKMLTDRAFEVRQTAAGILGVPTPE